LILGQLKGGIDLIRSYDWLDGLAIIIVVLFVVCLVALENDRNDEGNRRFDDVVVVTT